jgi:hypothetical protein
MPLNKPEDFRNIPEGILDALQLVDPVDITDRYDKFRRAS